MSIFGTVVSLPYKAGTIVFIAVLFALMILEGGKHYTLTLRPCHIILMIMISFILCSSSCC